MDETIKIIEDSLNTVLTDLRSNIKEKKYGGDTAFQQSLARTLGRLYVTVCHEWGKSPVGKSIIEYRGTEVDENKLYSVLCELNNTNVKSENKKNNKQISLQ